MGQACLLLLLGLVFLTVGAEGLVRGASRLARAWGVSPLAIGLTIVAFGTSTPELLVSVKAALMNKNDIALGNVIGSNIFNVLFILGACALILPLHVVPKLIKFDVPVMMGVSFLLYLICLDLSISRLEGFVFVALLILYTYCCFLLGKKENPQLQEEYDQEFGGDVLFLRKRRQILINCTMVFAGLVLLSLGSRWLVDGAVVIARAWGVSEFIIGVTIIAAGTSLPEVATSISATLKGERDIAIGNVVGSNIFNILMILGITGIVPAGGFMINPLSMSYDIPFMIFVAVLCYPVFRSGSVISRKEGALFLFLYLAYVGFLICKG